MTGNPIPRRTFLSVALASAAAAAAASCGFSDDEDPTTSSSSVKSTAPGSTAGGAASGSNGPASGPAPSTEAVKKGGTLRQSMIPVPHIDPAMGGSISARGTLIQAALGEGLVVRDPDDGTKVLPGVAEKWTVSDDGLVYTFNLRADAKWSNGDPVTAGDVVWNWERTLSPATTEGTKYKPSANGVMKSVVGAAEFFGGKSTDFSTVGVKAKDDRTLEITLTVPSPKVLLTLARSANILLHPATVEAHPDDWADPKNWVGNGSYVLTEWRANSGCTLKANDQYWDAASYAIDTWEIKFNDGGDTAQMLSYRADEIDTFMVEGDPAAIIADPALAKELQTAPPSQIKCLVLMPSKNTVLEDIRVRKALSLAIDREAIAKVAAPDLPGGSLVPSGITGYDKIPTTTFDPEQAKSLLADAGFPGGKGLPTINFLVFTPTPWLEAIGGMWSEHLGVQTAIDLVAVGVYGTKRREVQPEDYVGFSYGYFGMTPPTMFRSVTWGTTALGQFALPVAASEEFHRVFTDENINSADQLTKLNEIQRAGWFPEFKKYADLVDQAKDAAADPAKVQELSTKAAVAREAAYIALPVLWTGYSFMVKPRVHDLTITSYPEVFTLKGVTVDG